MYNRKGISQKKKILKDIELGVKIMRRLQKTMRIRYVLLMIILTVSLVSLRLSISNYNYIQEYDSFYREQMSIKENEVIRIN